MDVFITGGSGFVGQALCRALRDANHTVIVLSRSPKARDQVPRGVNVVLGDPTEPGPWQDEAAGCRWFINLAGASIFSRWDQRQKQLIRDSRVLTTRHLVQAMAACPQEEGRVLVSASAVGYYGPRGDEELDETASPGEDFLARVCRDWEAEAMAAEELGARVVRTRFGIVLGDSGGALAKMLPLFRMGLGGRLGSGRQWFSWIHQQDLVTAILFALNRASLKGPVNLTAPHPVTNREFTRRLAATLKRPAILPAPGFALRLAMGEMASVLLSGQKVIPGKLLKAEFSFHHPDLDSALADLLGEAD